MSNALIINRLRRVIQRRGRRARKKRPRNGGVLQLIYDYLRSFFIFCNPRFWGKGRPEPPLARVFWRREGAFLGARFVPTVGMTGYKGMIK
jgi:hypothetical protein